MRNVGPFPLCLPVLGSTALYHMSFHFVQHHVVNGDSADSSINGKRSCGMSWCPVPFEFRSPTSSAFNSHS